MRQRPGRRLSQEVDRAPEDRGFWPTIAADAPCKYGKLEGLLWLTASILGLDEEREQFTR